MVNAEELKIPPRSFWMVEKMEEGGKEKQGWLMLAEHSLKKLWENKQDDKVWNTIMDKNQQKDWKDQPNKNKS